MEISMDQDHFDILMKAIKNQISLSENTVKRCSGHSPQREKHIKDVALLYHLEQEFNYNFSF